mgnify:CR=1 FL=1
MVRAIGCDQCKRQCDIPPLELDGTRIGTPVAGKRIKAFKKWHEEEPELAPRWRPKVTFQTKRMSKSWPVYPPLNLLPSTCRWMCGLVGTARTKEARTRNKARWKIRTGATPTEEDRGKRLGAGVDNQHRSTHKFTK